jgi:GT2 family glycosyltransferase/lipopolysaccharide/colanic/teichoic acid biosynthesis glycosyltransferase
VKQSSTEIINPDVSVVIVNYNVKEYLTNLLHSIRNSAGSLSLETFVVDNKSTDGSVEYLKPRFPEVVFIENHENLGFGKANNQAIQKAAGKYILLINPDTLIREDTIKVMFDHMESNPNAGAAGCKLLNPDGTFAPESKRSVPTPLSALWKVLGLTYLFPHSRKFADYYLGWMDENETGSVPVLSGSFMFFRAEVLKKLDGFDERFFMYGEDIDLSYRVNQSGYRIDYVPATSIIHYKGESTKKENLDYVILFNKAMYQFFEKHYSYAYTFFFKLIIWLGIVLRASTSYLISVVKRSYKPASDLLILNLLVFVFFLIRYQIPANDIFNDYHPSYLSVNLLLSVFFIAFGRYYELYGLNKSSVIAVVKAVVLAFSGVVFITFFLRDFAFSRWILLFGAFSGALLLGLTRLYIKHYGKNRYSASGTLRPQRVLIVGVSKKTIDLITQIRSKVEWNYDIVGIIVQKEETWNDDIENIKVIGRTEHVPDLVRFHKIDQLIFLGNVVSSYEILNIMTQIRQDGIQFKIVPESMDFIIGKSNVEYFDDVPFVDVRLSYSLPWNVFVKRNLDFWLSSVILAIGFPMFLITGAFALIKYGKPQKVRYALDNYRYDYLFLWEPYQSNRWANRYLQIWFIFNGKISFVGAPIIENRTDIPVYYKPGLTGLRQINESRLFRESEKQKFEIHYVQNYSIWMDFDIIFRSFYS